MSQNSQRQAQRAHASCQSFWCVPILPGECSQARQRMLNMLELRIREMRLNDWRAGSCGRFYLLFPTRCGSTLPYNLALHPAVACLPPAGRCQPAWSSSTSRCAVCKHTVFSRGAVDKGTKPARLGILAGPIQPSVAVVGNLLQGRAGAPLAQRPHASPIFTPNTKTNRHTRRAIRKRSAFVARQPIKIRLMGKKANWMANRPQFYWMPRWHGLPRHKLATRQRGHASFQDSDFETSPKFRGFPRAISPTLGADGLFCRPLPLLFAILKTTL